MATNYDNAVSHKLEDFVAKLNSAMKKYLQKKRNKQD